MAGLPRRSRSAVSCRATRRPGIEVCRQALARHIIDDIENAEASAAGKLIIHKI